MPGMPLIRPPFAARCLVRVASWIVPSRLRNEWREKWDNALWNWWILFERGELTRHDRVELMAFSWGSFTDAVLARMSRAQMRHLVRSPGFVLWPAVLALVLAGILSEGFSGARALFRPLPVADPGMLVSIAYSGSADQPSGVPPDLVPLWRGRSLKLADLAGYTHRPYAAQAQATTNVFALLGVRPLLGRLFEPGDRDAAVITAATWHNLYGSDPRVPGTKLTLLGSEYTVVGVLPEQFWAVSPSIQVWTPLVLEPRPGPDVPSLIGAVGRLKPFASREQVRSDLFRAAREAGRSLPRPPEVYWFPVPGSAKFGYLLGIAFALVIGGAMVVRERPFARRHGWRYWTFLAAKTALLLAVPTAVWVEVTTRLHPPTGIAEALSVVVPTVLFLVIFAFAVQWSFQDQRARCPVCLRRLAMPVSMGSWSSVLDPATTEFLCDSGHGALSVAETESGESDRWTALDRSWRELFH